MDVNAVMLLKNVRNWLYFDQSMGKWGENLVGLLHGRSL